LLTSLEYKHAITANGLSDKSSYSRIDKTGEKDKADNKIKLDINKNKLYF
jgi:hypothetical protein